MAMRRTGKRVVAWLVVVVVVVLVAGGLAYRLNGGAATPGTRKGGGHHRGYVAGMVVPVDVAPVSRRDLPVYLSGLGTVEAFNTVTVRPQVGGQLISVPFHQGDEVKKGQLLAQIDPRAYQATLDQAKAKLAQDEAQLRTARSDLARFEKLAPQGYVSGQQLTTQQQLVAQDQAVLAADRAAIEADAIQLSYTRITSPITGRLGMRLVDVGNLVTAGESNGLVVVTQMKPIYVSFTLPEQDLEQVLAAQTGVGGVPLQVEALDRSNNAVLATGSLTAIDNQIETATGTIQLKATFVNDNEKLWPGQFVNVQLRTQTLKQVPVVPVVAVQQGPNGAYVYVVGKGDRVQMQTIASGVSQGGFTQVTQGLQVGQSVVVDGQYRLQPGAQVKVHDVTPAAAASTAAVAAPAVAP
ncbi:MAG TPA: efflux RND transporter periplasmic adaptor subunit [Nevskiaceae bacterium]|nr:efflux RND transporter periplasmic adaptor subunit [Nevskiaceae bacterium]